MALNKTQLEKCVDIADVLYNNFGEEGKFNISILKKVIQIVAGSSGNTVKRYVELIDGHNLIRKTYDGPYFRVDKERLDKVASNLGCSRDYLRR